MGKSKTAPCWTFFLLEEDDKAKCKLCGEIYSLGTGATTSLNRHLDTSHSHEFSKEKERLNSKKRKADINTFFGPCPKSMKTEKIQGASSSSNFFSQQTLADSLKRSNEKKNGWASDSAEAIDINTKLAEWIVLSNSSFNSVEEESFKLLINLLQPKYNMPGRLKLKEIITGDLYTSVEHQVAEIVAKSEYISMTTDLWTCDHAKHAYISLTAHCMFRNYTRQCIILNAEPFPENHSSENITKYIKQMIGEYNIPSYKVNCIVSDNAPSMLKGIKDSGFEGLPCFTHTIQLIINKSLFQQATIKDILKKSKSIVGHFSQSSNAARELSELQAEYELPKHRLLQDVTTRWNSTKIMFERLLEQKPAVNAYCCDHNLPFITPREWELMGTLVKILAVFHDLTEL